MGLGVFGLGARGLDAPGRLTTITHARIRTLMAGTTFTHWIADHNVLWNSPVTSEALAESIRYYALLGTGPQFLAYIYVGIGVAALIAAGWKLHSGWRGKGGEVLWDGASLCRSCAWIRLTDSTRCERNVQPGL